MNFRFISFFFFFLGLCTPVSALIPEASTPLNTKQLVFGQHAMVVTNNIWASKVATKILAQGGNAIDATIGAAFVLGLTEPQSSGIGGGGYALTYHPQLQALTAYDGREIAPKSAFPELFLDKQGHPKPILSAMLSPQSIGVPGMVNMLYRMHEAGAKLPWHQLVEPAIELATRGFPMSPRLYALLDKDKALLRHHQQIRSVYFLSENQIKPIGELVKNPAYASTLKEIAKDPHAFYVGTLATSIVKQINAVAGYELYQLSDFKNYATTVSTALCGQYKRYKICTTPFESGGVSVIELMKIFAEKSKKLPWAYLFLEASQLTFADRNQYIADPRFISIPLAGLLADPYIKQRSNLIQDHAMIPPVAAGHPEREIQKHAADTSLKPPGTTALAIVDKDGYAVSMTLSIEHQFGSHIFVNGFFLNNELTDFSFLPKNQQKIANRVEPLKRPRSAMAPTMIFDQKNQLMLITGSPGGNQIICYIAKTLIHALNFGQTIQASIAAPNLCATNSEPVIELNTPLMQAIPALIKRGESIKTEEMPSGVVGIHRATQGGWYGAADPRREGIAMGQ